MFRYFFGREAEKHLPYPVEGSGQYQANVITDQKNWYASATDTRPAETMPFTEITFENSPLNRVLSQLGPGEAWKTADKSTDFKYETNTATEVILWEVDGTSCKYNNHYAAGELFKNTVSDENDNATTEYKDKQGQVILKAGEEGTKTYYVYDDFGLLRFVIPPKAVEANGEANLKSDVLKNLCYYYEYDARNRMVLKKLPGAGAVTMKYDLRDRLIETVDSMQRSRGETSFITYDELNRPIRGGIRYSNNKADTLVYTFYDDYNFISAQSLGISYTDETGYSTNITDKVKGRVTGTRSKILGTDKYITTVSYYDKYGRVVQTQSINQFGHVDISTNQYHFWGGVDKAMMRHRFDASNELAIEQKFQYDHTGRLKSTSESVNKKFHVMTSQLAYDDLGQMASKKLHTTASGQLQKTDYVYNIRGWLKGINPTFNADENDLFGLNLYYTDTAAYGALKGAPQYNGNIRAMKWRHRNDVETGYCYQAYGFEYDKLNRLISGKHGIANASGIFPAEYMNRYNEDNLKYDNNGNILNLSRTGGYKDVDDLRFGQMDSLKYQYLPNSNQLMRISDNASVEGYGYNDVNKDTTDFVYDGNGNLTQYKDKKIKDIRYNYLNLPSKIVFDNNDSIVYIYDAIGSKHIKKFFEKGKQKNSEYYVGGIVYETDSTNVTAEKLRFVMNAEGRLVRLKNGSFRNEYFLKDHLGNTRVVFADTLGNGTLAVIQETNYYPFGLAFTGVDLKTEKNKFLYNGKELQVDGDLGWYSYGARFYDPQIGRWLVPDSVSEAAFDWTSYRYAFNNPVKYIDPNGLYESVDEMIKDAWYKTQNDENRSFTYNNGNQTGDPKGKKLSSRELASNFYRNKIQVLPQAPGTETFGGRLKHIFTPNRRMLIGDEEYEISDEGYIEHSNFDDSEALFIPFGPGPGINALRTVQVFSFESKVAAFIKYAKHVKNIQYVWKTKSWKAITNAGSLAGDVKSLEQYMALAKNFFNSSDNILTFVSKGGTVFKYNTQAGYFGTAALDGTIQTFYKLDPSKGLKYFIEQIAKYSM